MTGRRRIAWVSGALLAISAVMLCMGDPLGLLVLAEPLVYLVGGWIPFTMRVAPQIRVRWDLVASTFVYVFLLITGSHYFLRWLFREIAEGVGASAAPVWKWRWTLSGFLLVVAMFTAGMAAIGVAHQTGWLITSPKSLYQRPDYDARLKCASNLKEIGLAVIMYANDNGGRLFDDLSTLMLSQPVMAPSVFICPATGDVEPTGATAKEIAEQLKIPGHCSYVYLGKGLTTPLDSKCVLAFERGEDHEGQGIHVLRGDCTIEWLEKDGAEALLRELSMHGSRRGNPVPTTLPAR